MAPTLDPVVSGIDAVVDDVPPPPAAAEPVTNGEAQTNGAADSGIKDEPVENLRPLKVRVIGAGYSGICAAIR